MNALPGIKEQELILCNIYNKSFGQLCSQVVFFQVVEQ